jgi:hypothetical protein
MVTTGKNLLIPYLADLCGAKDAAVRGIARRTKNGKAQPKGEIMNAKEQESQRNTESTCA